MTRKHFKAIADTLRHYPFTDPQDRINLVYRLADTMQQFNERFDKFKFIEACGVHS